MIGTGRLNLVPSLEEARRLARFYDVVPLYAEFIGDLETPISAVLRFADEDTVFLLESAESAERFGRYSFLGFDPKRTLSYRNGVYTVVDADGVREVPARDPFRGLAEIVGKKSVAPLPNLPAFVGGAVGYFSYDAVRYLERLPDAPPDDLGVSEAYFAVTDALVVFDHLRHKVLVVALVDAAGLRDVEGEGVSAAYRRAADDIRRISERLSAPLARRAPSPGGGGNLAISSNFTREFYEEAVERAKEYIRAGDAFQIVPSQRFAAEIGDLDPLLLYRGLRTVNPSPYMTYLKLGGLSLVGASPEPLVRVEDRRVMTRPVAGTRGRGASVEEDASLAVELLADEKERAEHVMLVDLGRNDLGRVSEVGSVELASFMEVERYSHVMHIVSTVEGDLREGLTALDALAAAFPAGTVSGAPKVRAMEIIDELEPTRRGPYAGATGYYGIDGRLDTCITLRTALLKDGVAYFQAGGGVVADSVPSLEYEETRNKARAMARALEVARSREMWL
ncbi:MAG: anthranilate synthase component I [Actinomycetota bacterium]|nr:anthranilate synthase component I [Actinomycetota bacterium]